MTYLLTIEISRRDLEQLSELDLTPELQAKISDWLQMVTSAEQGLERAGNLIERMSWNAEMNKIFDWDEDDDPFEEAS